MGKITGIGGIFFKCKNPAGMRTWYQQHLGLNSDEYGANFQWRKDENPQEKGYTLLSMFDENTDYFGENRQTYMINFRVENMETLVEKLKASGVAVLDEIAQYEYGKFVHIADEEGNKIELWEPADDEYGKMIGDNVNRT